MATVCGKLYKGQDLSCRVLQKGYFQELVLVNLDDLDESTVTVDCAEETSEYNVSFALKQGTKGVMFKGPAAGNAIRGLVNMTRSDFRVAEYEHQVQLLLSGINQEQKCILHNLDSGRVFAVARIRKPNEDEQLEVFGLGEGLVTADYTYDVVEGGGIVQLTLHSDDNALESDLPYIYKPAANGDALLDFEALFENTGD